jgi:hypothetical protein
MMRSNLVALLLISNIGLEVSYVTHNLLLRTRVTG